MLDLRMHRTTRPRNSRGQADPGPAHSVGVVVLSQYANALYAFELFQDGTKGLALSDRETEVLANRAVPEFPTRCADYPGWDA